MVSREKWDALEERLHKLHVEEKDLIEKSILGSGSGGQKINKTSSCIYIKHIPSKIEVKCQRGRSQSYNKYLAYIELCDELERRLLEKKQKEIDQKEKVRRQKRRRSKSGQEKVLKQKQIRSTIKKMRKA